MSVIAFEQAIFNRPHLRLAIVSETLFYALDDLGKIELKQWRKALPEPRQKPGPVLRHLQRHYGDSSAPLTLTCFVLRARPKIHIDYVMLHDFHVDDTGANSFLLCDCDVADAAVVHMED